MPNFLSTERAHRAALRVWFEHVPEPLATRVVKLVLHALIADPRNARAASAAEIDAGPAWARLTAQPVHVFVLRRASAIRINDLRTGLLAFQRAFNARRFERRDLIDRLLRACPKMTLQAIEQHLSAIAQAYENQIFAMHYEEVYEHAQLTCDSGLVWVRVRSGIELHQCGRVLRNCCRRETSNFAGYFARMAAKRAEFWALRRPDGAPIGLAFISRETWTIAEVRGPGNAPLGNDAELSSLDASLIPLRNRLPRPRPAPDLPEHLAGRPLTLEAIRAAQEAVDQVQPPAPRTARLQSPN